MLFSHSFLPLSLSLGSQELLTFFQHLLLTFAVVAVAVAVAEDEPVLEAVKAAKEQGIADAILVGNEAKIREIAATMNMEQFICVASMSHALSCDRGHSITASSG